MFEIILSRRYFALVFIALLILGLGIGTYSLRGSTELRETGVAAEMLQEAQYVVPKLNGEPFLEKPPLSYWAQAACINLFGYHSAAVRLPSMLAGIACLCIVFFSLNKLYGRDMAWFGAILLLTMASFWMNARTAGQDILLAFGVALALLAFNVARISKAPYAWLMYTVGIAIAALTKGIVGLVVPGVVIVGYLAAEAIFIERKINWANCRSAILFAMVGAIPFLVWLIFLAERAGITAVKQILWSNSVGRFTGDYQFGAHSEPIYYYLKNLPETFAPWNLLLFIALWQLRHAVKSDKNSLFFFCWLIAPFILLSLSSGKRPTYLLMIYPAAAALSTVFADRLKNTFVKNNDKNIGVIGALHAVLISIVAVVLVRRVWHFHEHTVAIVCAVSLACILVLLFRLLRAREYRRMTACAALAMLVIYAAYGGVALKYESRQDTLEPVFAKMRDVQRDGYDLVLFQPSERVAGATAFYLQRTLPQIKDAQQLDTLLKNGRPTAVLSPMEGIDQSKNYNILASFIDNRRKYLIVAGDTLKSAAPP